MRPIVWSTAVGKIVTRIAFCGHASAQRPHPRQAASMIARLSRIVMALTKHISVQVPHPTHESLTVTSTPGILATLLLKCSSRCGSMSHKQQQGQQLQMVINFSSGFTFNHTESSLFLPMRCTRPASRQMRKWSSASSLLTGLPSRGSIRRVASPKNRHPSSEG